MMPALGGPQQKLGLRAVYLFSIAEAFFPLREQSKDVLQLGPLDIKTGHGQAQNRAEACRQIESRSVPCVNDVNIVLPYVM